MHFLTKDEAKIAEKKLRRQLAEQSKPKLVLYYKSGNRDYCKAATAIIKAVGSFTEVRVLFQFCVIGDGWSEGNATHRTWSRYREWRAAHGELRRLYDAPGHSFARRRGPCHGIGVRTGAWLGCPGVGNATTTAIVAFA
jgi:hypothetical protein